jgi:hypothetical protein
MCDRIRGKLAGLAHKARLPPKASLGYHNSAEDPILFYGFKCALSADEYARTRRSLWPRSSPGQRAGRERPARWRSRKCVFEWGLAPAELVTMEPVRVAMVWPAWTGLVIFHRITICLVAVVRNARLRKSGSLSTFGALSRLLSNGPFQIPGTIQPYAC